MSIKEFDDSPVGPYDYDAPSHPIHEDHRVTKALAELEKISRLEAAQRTIIYELTNPYRIPVPVSTDSNVISLKARRDARKPSGGRS